MNEKTIDNTPADDSSVQSPHDRYFRAMLTNKKVAIDFLEWHLPESIKEIVDLNTIEVKKDTFVDDNFKKLESDVLFSVKFNGKDGYIYSLVEAQKEPQRMMPLRIIKYLIAIMEHHCKETGDKTLPVIYPLIMYQGEKLWKHSTNFFELFNDPELSKQILTKDIQLVDIHRIPDEDFNKHFWAGLFEACIKWGATRDLLNTLQTLLPDFVEVEKLDRGVLLASLTYLGTVGDTSVNNLIEWGKNLHSQVGDEVVTLAKRLKKEGIEEGIEQGIDKRNHDIILNMLAEKLEPELISKITETTVDQIEELKAQNQDKF